jgi:hypothetical protein
MKGFVSILLGVFLSFSAFGQNNGFLGRHFLLTYNLHTMPRAPIVVLESTVPKFGIALRHELQGSAIIGRFTIVNASFHFGKYEAMEYERTVYHGQEQKKYNEKVDFSAKGAGLGFSFYNKLGPSPLAPVGNYIKVHMLYLGYKLIDETGALYYIESVNSTSGPVKYEVTGSSVRFGMGYGRTRVIKERIVIDYGIESDVGLSKKVDKTLPNPDYELAHPLELTGFGLRPMLFSVRLGVGGLLF